jgi:hypothetical protein
LGLAFAFEFAGAAFFTNYVKGADFDFAADLCGWSRGFMVRRTLPNFSKLIKPVAAPIPKSGVVHQPALYRIHVHVMKFLEKFLSAPNVEIVKPALPECAVISRAGRPGYALLQTLHDRGRSAGIRLGNKQMNVLRHNDVPNQQEPVFLPYLVQLLQKEVSRPGRSEERLSPEAAAGDEVQMMVAIPAFQWISGDSHGWKISENDNTYTRKFKSKTKSAPFANCAKNAAPEKSKTRQRRTGNYRTERQHPHPLQTAQEFGTRNFAEELPESRERLEEQNRGDRN